MYGKRWKVNRPWVHEASRFCALQELLEHLGMVLKDLPVDKLPHILLCEPPALKLKLHFCDWLGRRLPVHICYVLEIRIRQSLTQHNHIMFHFLHVSFILSKFHICFKDGSNTKGK
jgi:hypothetical protein